VAGRRAKRRREPLTRDRITAAALALIDARGIERFTTRELGRALGCEAMAVYRHFPSKEALLDAVIDRVMGKVTVPAPDSGDWAERARMFARSYRALSRVHPNAFPLLATRRFNTPATLAMLDRVFASYLGEGFAPAALARLYRALANYCTGAALQELADASMPAAPPDPGALAAFPALAKVAGYFVPAHADALFEWGLDLLLDAFAASPDLPRALQSGKSPRA
jgi:AcrR family transcriptional regulator